MSKSNILIVNPLGKSISGADESLGDLLKTLDNDRFNVIIALPQNSYYSEVYEEMGYNVNTVFIDSLRKSSNPLFYLKYLFFLLITVPLFVRLYFKYEVELVHINMHLTLGPAIAAKIYGVPVVYHYRTGTDISPEFFFKIFIKAVDWLSDRIIVISKAAELLFSEIANSKEKVEVIYDGVNLGKFNLKRKKERISGVEDESVVLGTITRIAPEKNLEICIKALSKLQSEREVKYLIVGDVISEKDTDYKRYLVNLVERLNLGNKVKFTGTLRNIPGVLKLMDLFLFPVQTKGFVPRCLLEAGVMGVPVIACRQSGVEEINLSDSFILLDGCDPGRWSEEIDRYIAGSDIQSGRERMKELYRKKFDTRNTTREIERVYEEELNCV